MDYRPVDGWYYDLDADGNVRLYNDRTGEEGPVIDSRIKE